MSCDDEDDDVKLVKVVACTSSNCRTRPPNHHNINNSYVINGNHVVQSSTSKFGPFSSSMQQQSSEAQSTGVGGGTNRSTTGQNDSPTSTSHNHLYLELSDDDEKIPLEELMSPAEKNIVSRVKDVVAHSVATPLSSRRDFKIDSDGSSYFGSTSSQQQQPSDTGQGRDLITVSR